LGRVAEAISVRPFGAGTGDVAPQEADIFDAVTQQTVEDHGIRPVDERADPFFPPDKPALVAFMGRLEHEPDPLRIGLALQAGQPASLAPEANFAAVNHGSASGSWKGK